MADFEWLYFVGQVCHGELNGSILVNYLHQVICRLNRCIWHAPCRRLLRNFPRGHFHAGGGGTVSNSVWLCVFCMNVCHGSSGYKTVTSIVKIYPVGPRYNRPTCTLTSHCVVFPSITVFSMPSKCRRRLFNTNHTCIFRNNQIS